MICIFPWKGFFKNLQGKGMKVMGEKDNVIGSNLEKDHGFEGTLRGKHPGR